MSQIGNKIMAGFFAFPESEGEMLSKLLTQEIGTGFSNWLDPTCGEGTILANLANSLTKNELEILTYGVELDKGRADLAAKVLNSTLNCPVESVVIQNESFGLVFLNPPYDNTIKSYGDSSAERKEYIELLRATKYIQPGGILCFTIPSYRFSDSKMAKYLSTHFSESAIMKFSNENYDDYKQSIFIGRKKNSKTKITNETMANFLMMMENEDFVQANVSSIEDFVGNKEWRIPSSYKTIKTFYTRLEPKSSYFGILKESSGFEAFKNRTKPKELEIGGNPILPLNAGQMALLLASGAINGKIGTKKQAHLVQGLEVVGTKVSKEIEVSPKGNKSEKVIESTTREVSIKIITGEGIVKKLM